MGHLIRESTFARDVDCLEKQNKVHFAWLCAVRALPFLGENGDFRFWEDSINQHLYNVLFAID
jgi:hypothetical protein